MNSIGKVTEDLINRSPFLREAMTDDLINISALARKLRPEIEEIIGKEVKEGAIIMAIKRMTPGLYHRLNLKITKVMGDLGDFLVRSNLIDYTFENSDSLKTKQSELIQEINKDNDSFFALCKGITETTFIVNSQKKDDVERIFRNEKLKSHTNDLASVTVKLPKINTEIYGIYYYILKHLAWEGINIIEIVSTSNEFTVVVKQDDVDKAFKILMQIKRGN
ncbi:MAG: aspartate kinase [Flavobacteriia bacterium]|jgi:3'-phosphoadenosine 5'-phosphosulfate sulfotransferase